VTASAGLLISGLCEKIKTLRSGAPISKGWVSPNTKSNAIMLRYIQQTNIRHQ
jgi:hypothetical protein